ncbi:RNA chaperone Hfq [Cupriavidus basilensis]|uniref:RNA-binding protein Hfq n=1 Tax=Cupriavidus basilensis OR16 TaxID=1127483 RepID=H1SH36_9BURK|nr:RNA chaperone Hfq [Cupriavidus basilensis]EHP38149.1 RNA chaperone Hfq [Cupriavidus basilensis OR16]NUA26696.1 RNA chaperone Hfq [Cupriavidus basilensis]
MQLDDTNPQNSFLNTTRKERKRVQVYLVSGIRLVGSIESFDAFVVMLSTPGGMQTIYKRAISTIQLDTGTRPPGGGGGARPPGAGPRTPGSGPRPPRVSSEGNAQAPLVVTRKRRAMAPGGSDE